MQLRQRVIRHQRKHVVLHVVVHVPVQIAVDPAHVHRAAVETMIENILGQTGVLRVPVSDHQPGAEEIRQANQQQWKDAAGLDGEPDDHGIEGDINACLAIDLGKFDLRNECFLLGRHAPEGVQDDVPEIFRIHLEIEERHDDGLQIGRTRNSDLRIAADDDGVAVMAGVAPAPDRGLAHHHERRDLVERVVHPVGLEGGTVAGLVPAGIGGRGVENAVDEVRENRPTTYPRARRSRSRWRK